MDISYQITVRTYGTGRVMSIPVLHNLLQYVISFPWILSIYSATNFIQVFEALDSLPSINMTTDAMEGALEVLEKYCEKVSAVTGDKLNGLISIKTSSA